MITILGVTGHWWLWLIGFTGGAALAVIGGRELLRRIAAPRYQWCDDCAVWCHEVNDPCDCCCDELAADLHDELELERIGTYDDGEPVTGELRAVRDDGEPYCGDRACTSLQCWEAGPHELSADEAWARELADINRARHTGELDEISLADTGTRRLYVDLSSDPDLIEWDAKQQAARTWEIAHVGFPALRAQITREYAAAAAELADYWRAA